MGKPFFSIGIIFKNEIRCLERCLKSLEPLRKAVPCELVMADTGSTDGSREIAAKYADTLFDFPWCDDFSAARNAVMDRCSGEWYFTIDADEWLREDISELAVFANAKSLPYDLGSVRIHNYNTVELDDTNQYSDFAGIRLCRMSTGVRYTGCIHEKWVLPGNPKAMMLENTWLDHDGYAYANQAAVKAKKDRNIALLEKKLADDPNDMQTLVECLDMMKEDEKGEEYARRLRRVLEEQPPHWENIGPVAFRAIIATATWRKMPELRTWITEAFDWFPNSMYTRVDVSYYALADYFNTEEYAEAVRWGKAYQAALAEYQAGEYNPSELLRGALDYSSPFWERKVFILLGHAYLEIGEPENAFSSLKDIDGGKLDEAKQVESITRILMRLHRTATLGTPSLISAFWEQINHPIPTEEMAKERREMFISTASLCFTEDYRTDEDGRGETLRHEYTLFSALEGQCALGTAAVILDLNVPAQIEKKLAGVENWDDLPISALAHALEQGVRFPLPGRPLNIEAMDRLAARLAKGYGHFTSLACNTAGADHADPQSICWARGLVIAAVRAFPWTGADSDTEQGMALAGAFAEIEKKFVRLCYAPSALTDETLFLLPPMHRFGFYCAQAFEALGNGGTAEYVRLLREGLETSEGMKDMVEFLAEHTAEIQQLLAPPELKTLADQVRVILARFDPNDPAVSTLKQSEAYQKVAYLIEGAAAPVWGGQPQ